MPNPPRPLDGRRSLIDEYFNARLSGGNANTMILHWLAGYSFAQLMLLAGGPIMFLGAAIMLFEAINGKGHLLWASMAGLLTGVCFTGANLLRGKPQWEELTDNLTIIAGASSIIYAVLIVTHRRSKPGAIQPCSESAAPSDKIWPPPPTSQGGS